MTQFRGYLVDAPGVDKWALAIGKLVSNFGGIEFTSYRWIERLSGDTSLRDDVLGDPLADRIKVILKLVEKHSISRAWGKRALRAWNEILVLNRTRATLSHGPMLLGYKGEDTSGPPDQIVIPNLKFMGNAALKSPREAVFSLTQVNHAVNEAHRLASEVGELLDAWIAASASPHDQKPVWRWRFVRWQVATLLLRLRDLVQRGLAQSVDRRGRGGIRMSDDDTKQPAGKPEVGPPPANAVESPASPLPQARIFVVALRGPSALWITSGGELVVPLDASTGVLTAMYATRWLKPKPEVLYPGHLWIEVSGPAASLDQAVAVFANAGVCILPILAMTMNTAIADPDIELAFEATAGLEKREYFQAYVTPETPLPMVGRSLDQKAFVTVYEALVKHPDSARLVRAAEHYRAALNSWKFGLDIVCVANLWRVVETLTPVVLRNEMSTRKLASEADLALALGLPAEGDKWEQNLRAKVRLDTLFAGDEETYKNARHVRVGFEHGHRQFDEIRSLSNSVRKRVASLLREAVLKLAGAPPEVLAHLTTAPFDEPRPLQPLAKYLRGHLIGNVEAGKLSREGAQYPFIRWKPEITSGVLGENGKLQITLGDTFAPELGEGVAFQGDSMEVWQPN